MFNPILTDHRTIRTKEKDRYGEVFTPYEFIIEDIMDNLPSTRFGPIRIYVWLDPCAGTGNFMSSCLCQIDEGFTQAISLIRKNAKPTYFKQHVAYD